MISRRRSISSILRAAAVALIMACSSDSTEPTSPPPQQGPPLTSGTVVVSRSSALLTGIGQSQQLSARTNNESGAAVNAAVVWSSSAPGQVSVDQTGRVTARAIGSAQIFATSGGVKSQPVFVVVAEPKPGALMVTDAQVLSVGPPIGVAADDIPGVGTRYEVRLTGISTPPAPGTVVLASETAMVAGKVVSTRNESGAMVVTLAMAPLGELLARYDIDWNIDLKAYPIVAEIRDSRRMRGSQSLAEAVRLWNRPLADDIEPFTPFTCDAGLAAVVPSYTISLTPTSSLNLDMHSSPGHTRRVLRGSIKHIGLVGLKFNAGFRFSGSCSMQALIRIPIGGPLALGVMPGIRIGVSAEVGGQIVVTAGEVSVSGEIGKQLEIGWECGGASPNCRSIESITPINELKPKVALIDPAQPGMRFELSAGFNLVLGLDAVFLTQFNAGVIEAKIGPVQSVNLGFEEDQALDPNYASNYDLKFEGVVEPGGGLKKVIEILTGTPNISVGFQGKFSHPISESPKGNLTVSQSNVNLSGQTVDLRVSLTNTDYFLYGYNVRHVELWRRRGTEEKFTLFKHIPVTASNQTTFQYTWTPTTDDIGPNDFAAFVSTNMADPALLPSLEINENSIQRVDVSCFSAAPRVVAGKVAAANTCADTWVGRATFFSPGQIRIDADVTWSRDPAIPEIDGDIGYLAKGIVNVRWLDWENRGCGASPTVFNLEGNGTYDASNLTVDFSESPYFYYGLADILMPVVVTCPDAPPTLFPTASLWFGGSGEVTAGGTLIQGRNDLGNGIYFEWRFTRP